jgi:glycosyltransferase involved in cell wall biosynthesis
MEIGLYWLVDFVMNVFVIPSWYPSPQHPIYGTFIHEQVRLVSQQSKDVNQGVSLWGQGDPQYLLWSKEPIQSLRKRLSKSESYQHAINAGLTEYFTPAYTWSRKFLRGNIKGILEANLKNFQKYQQDVGSIDLIHAQASYPASIVAWQLAEKYQIPYIVTIRMSPFPFQEFLQGHRLSKLIQLPLKTANRLIATSHALEQQLKHYDLTHVTVLHNPVDLDFFKPGNLKTTRQDKIQLLAIGRLETQKGFDLLIPALSYLPTKYHLKIIGQGSQKKVLEEKIEQYNLQERVQLLGEGSRKQVLAGLQQCDLFVLSSRHETFGNVLLEAMACGKPVVSTDCGGPRDIVSTETGILCETGSSEALAEAIQLAMQQQWDQQNIRMQVEKRFSPAVFTEKLVNLYHWLTA